MGQLTPTVHITVRKLKGMFRKESNAWDITEEVDEDNNTTSAPSPPHGEPQLILSPVSSHTEMSRSEDWAALERKASNASIERVRQMSVGIRKMSVTAMETITEVGGKVGGKVSGDVKRRVRHSISDKLIESDHLAELCAAEEHMVYSERPWQQGGAPRRSTFADIDFRRRENSTCW